MRSEETFIAFCKMNIRLFSVLVLTVLTSDLAYASRKPDFISSKPYKAPDKELDEVCKKVPVKDRKECLKFIRDIKRDQAR